MQEIIFTKGLNKVYKKNRTQVVALDNVDISVKDGETVAVLGTSGCGKSTLLSILAGLERPSSGGVFVMEKPIHKMSESKLVDFRLHNVGFVFQSFQLFSFMTALENAAFPLNCLGVDKKGREKRAYKLLCEMGIKEHIHHRPFELSGGQQQRVAIARAIISKPRIVFADEPTGNLDSKTSETIMDMLVDYSKENNSTLFMVTHDIKTTKNIDKIIKLSDGCVIDIEEDLQNEI